MSDLIWPWVGILGSIMGLVWSLQIWRRGRNPAGGVLFFSFAFYLLGIAAEWWGFGTMIERALTVAFAATALASLVITYRRKERQGSPLR